MGEGKLRTEMPLARVLGVVDEDRVGLLDELGSAVLDQCSVKDKDKDDEGCAHFLTLFRWRMDERDGLSFS